MRTVLLLFPALFAALITAQVATTLPNTLPACAQQCTILTSAQQSCASNAAAYQSCFCQSALLSQLYTSQPVQLCTQCSATDMASIQTWYKASCQNGAPVAGANQPTTTSATTTSPSTATSTPKNAPTAGTTVTNQQDSNNAQNNPTGPWMSTHYKWVIMLVVLFFGLIGLAFVFWFLHRRYHRRREAQWGQATGGSMPNINTWGPNQSVHDLGYTPGASANVEKGKGREQVRGINEPPPARMRENRLSKF